MKVIIALSVLALANGAVVPPLRGCGEPECKVNETVHFPHIEPGHFWQCAPEVGCATWKAVKMPCPPGLWFSYEEQVCVRCSEWENPCGLNPAPECECDDPGSGIDITEPPPVDNCDEPTCWKTELLFPHMDPTKFYQCGPEAGCDEWKAYVKQCPSPLFFSYKHQVCVWECDWENICGVVTPTTDKPTTIEVTEPTTPKPTTPKPTTPKPTTPKPTTPKPTTPKPTTTKKPTTTTEKPTTIDITEKPPPGNCEDPICSNTTLLYPHIDQHFYWQCAPEAGCDAWRAVKMPCPKGTWFSYHHQVCVFCADWENPCGLDPAPECECVDPGESIEITEPPPHDNCDEPTCWKTELLFPHRNPTKFYQCAPIPGCDEWGPVVKTCPDGLFFSYKHQVCDWCNDHNCDSGDFFNVAPKCP